MKISQIGIVNQNSTSSKVKQNSAIKNSSMDFSAQNRALPSSNNLQAYYLTKNPALSPSFGHLKIEHLQNGAYVDKAKNVFFKLFTFKDVDKVFVEIKNKATHELEKQENGIFTRKLSPKFVTNGDKYRFKLVRNGEVTYCKDPYAMKRDSVLDDFSEIYDHNQYKWSDSDWMNNKNLNKVSTRGQYNGLKTIKDLKIYEMNVATVTKDGNLKAAKRVIDKIANEGIFNSVELMPMENTHSYNWGYDGVDKFAPQMSVLGGPDALKDFVDYAHKKNLNIIMDIVPNHVGTDGNSLKETAPYINSYANGAFGDKFNLENDPENNRHVRDYVTNMCLNWLDHYHCDGLRLDFTKDLESDYTLKEIAMEVRYHHPDAVLIAEDARNNLPKLTKPLSMYEVSPYMTETEHANMIKKVENNEVPLDNLGFDSEWDFPFFHNINDLVNNRANVKNVDNVIKGTGNRIKFPMSHDEIGNMDGTRLISKVAKDKLGLFNKIEGIGDVEKHQRAAHATQAILESKVSGEYDRFSQNERMNFLRKHHVMNDVTPREVDSALKFSLAKHRLAVGETFITPGPKMLFQGDEEGSLSYFKFFRKLSPSEEKQDLINLSNKGYEPGEKAFLDSKMDKISYSENYQNTMGKLRNYTKDLATLSDSIPALRNGEIVNTVVHPGSDLHAVHLKKGNSEVFTISNFKDCSYQGNYGINFPKGEWKEVLNSNDVNYGGSGSCTNNLISSDGANNSNISIPRNSVLIFKRIK